MAPVRPRRQLMDLPKMNFAPIFRVILHYTQWEDNKEIARRITRAIPAIRGSNAIRIVENAVLYGSAIIIVAPIDEATIYETKLTRMGLKVSLDIA